MLFTNNTVAAFANKTQFQNISGEKNVGQQKVLLAKELFGKQVPASKEISFGWSDYLSDVETEILETITDPANRKILVSAHSFPDGDAYGSSVGMAGVLKSLGKKVNVVIDYRPKKTFQNCPSPVEYMTTTEYVREANAFKEIKKVDLAIITDTAEPYMLNYNKKARGNKMLQNIVERKPKKIIIIDHHPDEPDEVPNKEKWLKALRLCGYKDENVIYWREKRASAAEMVSEIDQEVVKESRVRDLPEYDPNSYHGYRLMVATGIITDAGGTETEKGKILDTKFARLSYKKPAPGVNPPVPATRHDFEWLIKNSGVPVEDIDKSELISHRLLDPVIASTIKDVVYGKEHFEGIEVKRPSKGDPFGYVLIDNWKGIEQFADEKEIPTNLVYKIIKSQMVESLYDDKNAGFMVLANHTRSDETFLTLRSYGYDYTKGELHKEGHVFGDSLSIKACSYLEKYYGSGGGHKNACGFKSHKNVDFKTMILPRIQEVVDAYITKNPELDQIPADKLAKLNRISFNGNIKFSI